MSKYKGVEYPRISVKEASLSLGLAPNTIRAMCDRGELKYYSTRGGHRRIEVSSIEEYKRPLGEGVPRKRIAYARVSSKAQQPDLERQIGWLRERCPDHEIWTDIGSGINYKRPRLKALLDYSVRGIPIDLAIAHRDRLARFGFELIEHVIQASGGTIRVLSQEEHSSPETELAEDLLSIVHVFSCRHIGRRGYSVTKPDIEEAKTGSDIQPD